MRTLPTGVVYADVVGPGHCADCRSGLGDVRAKAGCARPHWHGPDRRRGGGDSVVFQNGRRTEGGTRCPAPLGAPSVFTISTRVCGRGIGRSALLQILAIARLLLRFAPGSPSRSASCTFARDREHALPRGWGAAGRVCSGMSRACASACSAAQLCTCTRQQSPAGCVRRGRRCRRAGLRLATGAGQVRAPARPGPPDHQHRGKCGSPCMGAANIGLGRGQFPVARQRQPVGRVCQGHFRSPLAAAASRCQRGLQHGLAGHQTSRPASAYSVAGSSVLVTRPGGPGRSDRARLLRRAPRWHPRCVPGAGAGSGRAAWRRPAPVW